MKRLLPMPFARPLLPRLASYLRFAFRRCWTFARKSHKHSAFAAACFAFFIFIVIKQVSADASWTQTDWSGGAGSSTVNQYSSASGVDTTGTAGQVSLTKSAQLLSNTGFETNLSGWNAGALPSDIAGLKAWYKADSISGHNDGDAISSWSDSSGSGLNLSQGSGSQQPLYKTNILNGQPVVRFDGSNDYMNNTSISGFSNAASIFLLQVVRGNQCGGSYELGLNSGVNSGISNLPWCGSTMYSRFSSSGGGDTTWAFTTPYTDEITQVYNGSAHTANTWENGVSKSSKAANATFSTAPNTLTLGALTPTNYWLQDDIGEFILYNSAVSDSDRAQIESYIQNKYGLSSSNQTITRDTATKYDGTASAKIIATSQNTNYWQTATTPDTSTYGLSAYVYTDGSAVTSSDAQLYSHGSALTTTYTSAGGGWYKLSAAVTGSTTATDYGVQVKSGKTAYVDDMSLLNYPTSGTLTSAIFDGTTQEDWGTLTYNATVPPGTIVSVKVRSGNQADLSDASAWTSCAAINSSDDATSTCAPDKTRYAQYQISFSSDGTGTPIFSDISLGYSASDTTRPPTNASNILMYKSHGGDSVSSNGWVNSSPYFSWTAGADDIGGSGIKGYCLYVGQDSLADPVTTKGYLGSSPVNTGDACQFAVSGTSIDLSTAGYLASALPTSSSPYYLIIKAIDNANNVYNGTAASFQFRYDSTPPSNPSFITAPSQFVGSKDVTLTWPTSGSDTAADADSGVAGLQYRIGSSGTWYGANHNGNQDTSDLLLNNGSYETDSAHDYDNLNEGNNLVYFRTWDNAGNVSLAYVTTVIKINTKSPSSPQNLTATPSSNTLNSFAFSWLAPANLNGDLASNVTYCYTVNVLPSDSSCTSNYTAAGTTSLPAGAYATQPHDNTFYVVAKDGAGNINYATATSVTFTADTAAPGIPLNADIADISVKATHNWKLALSWEEPTQTGAGVASYKILRSTDNVNFSQVASNSGTSYVDSGLTQQTYYYKVKACDSANNCGAFTNVISKYPTGKFTSPASLLTGPVVSNLSTKKATISWVTDRSSDSKVAYGTKSGTYSSDEIANSDQTVNHAINLVNLSPGTTYYYITKWTDEDGNTGTSAENSFTTSPAPSIKDVTVTGINVNTATINFTSSRADSVKLYYGTSDSFGALKTINTSQSTSTYSIQLSGLNDGTKYYFKLNTIDGDGNEYDNPQANSFTTPPRPRISNLRFQPVPNQPTSTQQITWDTNVPASSELAYGPDGQAQQNAVDSHLVTSHSMIINALADNTQYSLTAQSRDTAGNLATSDKQVFHTALDTRPPEISGLKVTPSIKGTGTDAAGQIVVSWKTDEPATSQVAYGQGSDNSNFNTSTAEDSALVTDHAVVVSNLSTSQIFHLQALSKDAAGNLARSDSRTTIIGNATDSVISIIFNALQKVFGGF